MSRSWQWRYRRYCGGGGGGGGGDGGREISRPPPTNHRPRISVDRARSPIRPPPLATLNSTAGWKRKIEPPSRLASVAAYWHSLFTSSACQLLVDAFEDLDRSNRTNRVRELGARRRPFLLFSHPLVRSTRPIPVCYKKKGTRPVKKNASVNSLFRYFPIFSVDERKQSIKRVTSFFSINSRQIKMFKTAQ